MNPKRRIIPIFVPHMGCPNDCVFCNQRRISGEREQPSEETVYRAAELTGGMPSELAFYGGSFTAIKTEKQDELLMAAQTFLAKNPDNKIRISTRPDCISDDKIESLKLKGVHTIELGAQSMCDEVLFKTKRGHTAEDVRNASRIIKRSGVNLILQMMTGLPGDTGESSLMTAHEIIALKPDGVRIYPTVIVKDTRLHEMWKCGLYSEHTVDDAVELCAVIFELFQKAEIPVIRLGLNPTEELSGGAAVAGAYHPAFGELVYSLVFYNKAAEILKNTYTGGDVIIHVNSSDYSKMLGHKKCNISRIKEVFSLKSLKVVGSDMKKGEIKLSTKCRLSNDGVVCC